MMGFCEGIDLVLIWGNGCCVKAIFSVGRVVDLWFVLPLFHNSFVGVVFVELPLFNVHEVVVDCSGVLQNGGNVWVCKT
jgi:hypothetical protein